jgi:hypothetical protein
MHGPSLVMPVTKKQSKMGLELDIFLKRTFSDLTDTNPSRLSPLPKRLALGGSISLVEIALKGEVLCCSSFLRSELFLSTRLISLRR